MDGKEIFKEILSSPKMKELMGVPESENLDEDYNSSSLNPKIAIVRSIIEGQIHHTSEDALFKSIKQLYDL